MKSKLLQVAVVLVVIALAHAQGATFNNPIISPGADPWCINFNGSYYLMQTFDGLNIQKSPHLLGSQGIKNATPITVFTPPAPYDQEVWAPELHYINGNWYIYYTASQQGTDGNLTHRMYCAKGNTQDPMGSYTYMGQINTSGYLAIDGTVFQNYDGSLYFIWSGRNVNAIAPQYLYIAPMSNPWTLSGGGVQISAPTYSWEGFVNEGPEILVNGSHIFLIYSANNTATDNYCLGQLTYNGGSFLSASSWSKKSTPVFQTYVGSDGAAYAPGHCSFTTSVDGTQNWIVFHTAQHEGSGDNREIHIQQFGWNSDGSPNFGHPYPDGDVLSVPSGEGLVSATTSRKSNFQLKDGRMVTFNCGYPDGSVWTTSENTPGGSWTNWSEFVPTSGFKRLDASQESDGTCTLFGVGDYTPIWINWQNVSNGPWAGFYSMGGNFQDCKAFRYNDGRRVLFGTDGYQIWSNAQVASNSAWGGWGTFPGTGFTQVSPILLPNQTFVLFAVGYGTPVYMDVQTNVNSGWTGWVSLGGNFENVRAFRYNDGRFSVFAGDENLIWNNAQFSSNGVWSGWGAFPGSGFTQYDPIKLSDERFALTAINGGSIWYDYQQTYGGAWAGWTNTGNTAGFSQVYGNQLPDGRLCYFGNAPGSSEWFRYQAVTNGIWYNASTNLGGSVY